MGFTGKKTPGGAGTVQNASILVHGLYTTAIAKNQVSRKGSNAQRRLLYRYRRVDLSRTRGAFGSGAAAVESAADSVFARSCGRVGVLVGLDGCEVLLSLIRVLVCALVLVGPASRARVGCAVSRVRAVPLALPSVSYRYSLQMVFFGRGRPRRSRSPRLGSSH